MAELRLGRACQFYSTNTQADLSSYHWATVLSSLHTDWTVQLQHGALISPGPPPLSLPPRILHHPPHPLVLHLPLPRRLQRTVRHRSVSQYFKFVRVLMFFCRNKMIAETSEPNLEEEFLENWTKWRLYLTMEPGTTVTVYPNSRLSLANMVLYKNSTIRFL